MRFPPRGAADPALSGIPPPLDSERAERSRREPRQAGTGIPAWRGLDHHAGVQVVATTLPKRQVITGVNPRVTTVWGGTVGCAAEPAVPRRAGPQVGCDCQVRYPIFSRVFRHVATARNPSRDGSYTTICLRDTKDSPGTLQNVPPPPEAGVADCRSADQACVGRAGAGRAR